MTGNPFDGKAPSAAGPAEWFTAHCDGGSRGNPGPAGYGAVIEDPQGVIVARLNEYLGRQTNNYAEYKGLLAVLDWALKNGARRLRVVSDSELMARQMKGRYKVKSPGLLPLWEEAQKLARQLEAFTIEHTLRAATKRRISWRMRRWTRERRETGIKEQEQISASLSPPNPAPEQAG